MNSIRNSSRLITLIFILLISAVGCKSKKKAMEASNAAAAREKIEQEAVARKQREEELKRKEAEEKARNEAEARQREAEVKESAPTARVNEYFAAIATSNNVASANNSIKEALMLFASPETPVLIVISEVGGAKDYDRPTTIKEYLNYLKDQKKNINAVSTLKVDGSGKITEVELKKNY